jgi:hypothetical protein
MMALAGAGWALAPRERPTSDAVVSKTSHSGTVAALFAPIVVRGLVRRVDGMADMAAVNTAIATILDAA